MNSYEVVMVFSLSGGEESVAALYGKFKEMIEKDGVLGEVDEWGKRKLAYPINDEAEGYYYIVNYQANPEFNAELSRVFNITDGVLRTMIVKK